MSWCRKKQIFRILHLLPTSLPSYRSTNCWLVETVLLHRRRSFNCRRHWIWLECFKNLLSLKLNHKETRISKDFRLKYILQILNMQTNIYSLATISFYSHANDKISRNHLNKSSKISMSFFFGALRQTTDVRKWVTFPIIYKNSNSNRPKEWEKVGEEKDFSIFSVRSMAV